MSRPPVPRTVTPTTTTTYTLTAVGATGNVTATATVTVGTGGGGAGNPQILRFEASPLSIQPGQQSTLSWTTTGATQVSISGVGAVTLERQHHGVAGDDHHLHAVGYFERRQDSDRTDHHYGGERHDSASRSVRGNPIHHRCRQLYQAVLAGDGRHQHLDPAGRGQQSQCERLRHGKPDR